MSSRLVILPKKSYCPWKPENVERVLRDEAEHQKQQEAAAQQQRKRESTARLKALKGKQDDSEQQLRHVNFFEAEEKREHDKLLQTRTLADSKAILPVYLDKKETEKKRPFYLRDNPFEKDEMSDREKKRKAEMDPMQAFQRQDTKPKAEATTMSLALVVRKEPKRTESSSDEEDSSKKRKRRRKEKRRKSHKKEKKRHRSETKSNSLAVEELRQRRLEREQKEKQRTAQLVIDTSRKGKYQDQFNPSLSRR